MGARGIFVILFAGAVCLQGIKADDTCAQQFNGFRACVRNQMSRDQNDPTASSNRRQQVQKDVAACASQNGCQNPYPPDYERQSREYCFSQARGLIRDQLQWCVRYSFSSRDFQLPGDDNDKDAYWNFILLRTVAAVKSLGDNRYNRNRGNKQQWQRATGNLQPNDICGNDDNKKNKTAQCIKDKGVFDRTSAKSNWRRNSCRIKRLCTQVSQQCKQQWDTDSKPRLCDCVSTLKNNGSLKSIQDNYIQCLRYRGVRNVDQNNDDGRLVVQRMLSTWCPKGKLNSSQINQTDPCNRRRNNTGNVQTQTADDGTSVQADTNPFAGMLGGVDPLSSAAGGGSSLFGGGSSLFGGGNPLTSLAGGGSPLSSLGLGGGGGGSPLSSLGGGGLGGLFGGASPLGGGGGNFLSSLTGAGSPLSSLTNGGGLLSAFTGGGGSPLDAASSMGAFGGGGDILSSLGGDSGNILGSMAGFGKKK